MLSAHKPLTLAQIAHDYITQWQTLGIDYNTTTPHAELSYGNASSYVLLYNLFGDAELGLQLVPQKIYDYQSNFYPTVFNEYGVPFHTRHTYTKGESSTEIDERSWSTDGLQATGRPSAPP